MGVSLQNTSQRAPPQIFTALKQKRSIFYSEKARILAEGIGEGTGGKINPPSLLHYSFLSPSSPICVYFASFCATDPKKNILAAIKCRLCSNRYRYEKTAA